MSKNLLREGIEEVKRYYIKKLQKAGVLESDSDLEALTLSELQRMVEFYQL
ncbi:Fur-regulated basic protein FbpA [Virgibacillus sp. Bac332]|uniref:Fur-regulated basic protein FbpA n=1 Tax=Virgibacillus sp. Bac332 TaxID=2419842 RepID=UPI000EF4F247|nr:Fur-regulated basic protein FbpA [Virgibacillus sp. Bac332]